jgi:hypothetical protein
MSAGKLNVVCIPVCELDAGLLDALWELYAQHYDNVRRDVFEADLANKQSVFVGVDARSGAVKGFSTAVIYQHRCAGRRIGIYFSGDTIVHPEFWGQKALHKAVLRALLRWKLRHPFTPLYWFLICSGYRTYLTMVRTFPEHWPHHARPLPEWERSVIDSIARERFGAAWHPERGGGVVSTDGPQAVVKQRVAPLTPELLAMPEIRFFLRVNPDCERGDELAMIGCVNANAYARFVLKLAGRWVQRLVGRLVMPRPMGLGSHS